MNQNETQTWERVRAAGQGKFVWREGILRRGLPFGLIMVAFHLLESKLPEAVTPDWSTWLIRTTYYVVGFGGLFGVHLWHENERKFTRSTDDVSQT